MFIVVAIVIFGIFVVLANSVFGSEGLSNDLKVLFENATERVNNTNYMRTLTFKDWKLNGRDDEMHELENGYLIHSEGNNAFGLMLNETYINHGVRYELSFDITKMSGDITRIGGHLHKLTGTDLAVYIDDVLVSTDFHKEGASFVFDENTHNVRVIFTGTKEDIVDNSNRITKSIYIQPNRYYGDNPNIENYGKPYSAKIENIILQEI